jgi:hypothetical protein
MLVVLLFQCKKLELPEPVDQEPVFTVAAELGGNMLSLAAGEEGYRLQASHETDSTGLTLYTATFEPLECCGQELKFIIRGLDRQSPMPNSAIRIDSYDYYTPLMDSSFATYTVNFESEVGSTEDIAPYAYFWDLGDGTSETVANPVHEYEDLSPRTVRLEVMASNGCMATYEREIDWNTGPADCRIDFDIKGEQQNTIVQADFPDSPVGGGDYSDWYWNDHVDSSFFPLFISPFPPDTIAQICLTATSDSQMCRATACEGVYSKQDSLPFLTEIHSCEAFFTYQLQIDSTIIPAPEQLGTVIIEYTDESGAVYSTALGNQLAGPFFTVTAIEDFEANEQGDATRKLDVSFEALLYDESGAVFAPISGNAVIAVSVP